MAKNRCEELRRTISSLFMQDQWQAIMQLYQEPGNYPDIDIPASNIHALYCALNNGAEQLIDLLFFSPHVANPPLKELKLSFALKNGHVELFKSLVENQKLWEMGAIHKKELQQCFDIFCSMQDVVMMDWMLGKKLATKITLANIKAALWSDSTDSVQLLVVKHKKLAIEAVGEVANQLELSAMMHSYVEYLHLHHTLKTTQAKSMRKSKI